MERKKQQCKKKLHSLKNLCLYCCNTVTQCFKIRITKNHQKNVIVEEENERLKKYVDRLEKKEESSRCKLLLFDQIIKNDAC